MSRTGIVRDEFFLDHDNGLYHPEKPERLRAIHRVLDGRKWPGLTVLDRRTATMEEITLVHRPAYYTQVAETDGRSVRLDPDTSTSPQSFKVALAAAGGLVSLTEKVLSGKLKNGFAFVRPPGHHAEADRAMGFCIFNNAAIAAAWALENMGLSRVMLVDWDLHHGNGTQHSFYKDDRVLYFSTHQHPFYPGSGNLTEVGADRGEGFTVNVPLRGGQGDSEYVAIFRKVVLPIARAYKPQLIVVSAGFDIFMGDPLGSMQVTPEGFAAMARLLGHAAEETCGGKIVYTLEGGYNIDGQAMGVEKVLEVLTGSSNAGRDLAGTDFPEPPIVDQVRKIQSAYWDI